MDSPWTNADLYRSRLGTREKVAAAHIAEVAYDYAVNHRYGYHHAFALVADHLARVTIVRQPLILAHACAHHRTVVGVQTFLRAHGADMDIVDRIVAVGRRARRVERRPVRSPAWTQQPA